MTTKRDLRSSIRFCYATLEQEGSALWLVSYLLSNPKATLSDVLQATENERQETYKWLFRSHKKRAQDIRIRTLLEKEAFDHLYNAWKKPGFHFTTLVPSLRYGHRQFRRHSGRLCRTGDNRFEIHTAQGWLKSSRVINRTATSSSQSTTGSSEPWLTTSPARTQLPTASPAPCPYRSSGPLVPTLRKTLDAAYRWDQIDVPGSARQKPSAP